MSPMHLVITRSINFASLKGNRPRLDEGAYLRLSDEVLSDYLGERYCDNDNVASYELKFRRGPVFGVSVHTEAGDPEESSDWFSREAHELSLGFADEMVYDAVIDRLDTECVPQDLGWTNTKNPNVSVTYDAEEANGIGGNSGISISHRYTIDEDGEPVEQTDSEAILTACEATLALHGIRVCLLSTDRADTVEAYGMPEDMAGEVIYPAIDSEWVATHRITFISVDGKLSVEHVYLRDGAAYTPSEWRAEGNAAWTFSREDGWSCEGRVTPGGVPGTVTIDTLDGSDLLVS